MQTVMSRGPNPARKGRVNSPGMGTLAPRRSWHPSVSGSPQAPRVPSLKPYPCCHLYPCHPSIPAWHCSPTSLSLLHPCPQPGTEPITLSLPPPCPSLAPFPHRHPSPCHPHVPSLAPCPLSHVPNPCGARRSSPAWGAAPPGTGRSGAARRRGWHSRGPRCPRALRHRGPRPPASPGTAPRALPTPAPPDWASAPGSAGTWRAAGAGTGLARGWHGGKEVVWGWRGVMGLSRGCHGSGTQLACGQTPAGHEARGINMGGLAQDRGHREPLPTRGEGASGCWGAAGAGHSATASGPAGQCQPPGQPAPGQSVPLSPRGHAAGGHSTPRRRCPAPVPGTAGIPGWGTHLRPDPPPGGHSPSW